MTNLAEWDEIWNTKLQTPDSHLDPEINRILAMGHIDVQLNTVVGKDISAESLEKDYDAVLGYRMLDWKSIAVPNSDAPNCISAIKYLEASRQKRLHVTAKKVVCIGGGDTSIDVVCSSRRLGTTKGELSKDIRPENILKEGSAHDKKLAEGRIHNDVTLTTLFKKSEMTASEHEVHDAMKEGVQILDEVMPLEVLIDEKTGRAYALKMAKCSMKEGRPEKIEGTEFEIEADLIVAAIGQSGVLDGLEEFNNGKNLIDAADNHYGTREIGHFVAGDITLIVLICLLLQ